MRRALWIPIILLANISLACATVSTGRPPVFDNPAIRRVAVLGYGHDFFSDSLTAILVNWSHWQVVDRAHLATIINEQDRQHTYRFDDATAARIGRLAGVDMVIVVVNYGDSATVKGIHTETARYFAFQTFQFNREWDTSFRAHFVATAFLPWRWTRKPGGGRDILVGPNADKQRQ